MRNFAVMTCSALCVRIVRFVGVHFNCVFAFKALFSAVCEFEPRHTSVCERFALIDFYFHFQRQQKTAENVGGNGWRRRGGMLPAAVRCPQNPPAGECEAVVNVCMSGFPHLCESHILSPILSLSPSPCPPVLLCLSLSPYPPPSRHSSLSPPPSAVSPLASRLAARPPPSPAPPPPSSKPKASAPFTKASARS